MSADAERWREGVRAKRFTKDDVEWVAIVFSGGPFDGEGQIAPLTISGTSPPTRILTEWLSRDPIRIRSHVYARVPGELAEDGALVYRWAGTG